MSLSSRLEILEKRHRKLDTEIAREAAHSYANELVVIHLKKKKLRLKEEIDRISDLL